MQSSRGVVYVAYGTKARAEAAESIASLRQHNPWLPWLNVIVIGDGPAGDGTWIPFPREDAGGRWAKLNISLLSPFSQTLYLDADTRVAGDLSAGFQILDDGFDLVIAPSTRQNRDCMGHLNLEDRLATIEALGTREPLALQAGVFYFARNDRTRALFAAWRQEWERFRLLDQGALLRALIKVPVRMWLLSNEWNGGSIVQHRFGRAR